MKDDNSNTLERHEMLLDAIHEAAEEAIVCGCVPVSVVRQIEEATRRLRQHVRRDDAVHLSGANALLDEHDLAEWERATSLQAAVLAAMLCNNMTED
jgi:hypothetical protein